MEKYLVFVKPTSQESFTAAITKFIKLSSPKSDKLLAITDSSNNNTILLKTEDSVQTTIWIIALKELEVEHIINDENDIPKSIPKLTKRFSQSKQEKLNTVKPKSEYVVDELIKTEQDFIENIKFVETNYILKLKSDSNNPEMKEEFKMIFLNWEQLYNEASKFLCEIKKCGYNYDLIGELFLNSVDLFEEMCFYLMNQPVANSYADGILHNEAKKIQADINDSLGLRSYLLIPTQRLTRYLLLLEALLNSLENCDNYPKLSAAIEMVRRVTEESNSFIAARSIANLPFHLKDQGKFIRKDTFDCIEGKHNVLWRKVEVFLFEKVVIFAAIEPSNNYLYKDSIYLEHMTMQINDEPILVDFMRNKLYNTDKFIYILKSKDPEISSKWRKIIENQLWLQMVSIKEKWMDSGKEA